MGAVRLAIHPLDFEVTTLPVFSPTSLMPWLDAS